MYPQNGSEISSFAQKNLNKSEKSTRLHNLAESPPGNESPPESERPGNESPLGNDSPLGNESPVGNKSPGIKSPGNESPSAHNFDSGFPFKMSNNTEE